MSPSQGGGTRQARQTSPNVKNQNIRRKKKESTHTHTHAHRKCIRVCDSGRKNVAKILPSPVRSCESNGDISSKGGNRGFLPSLSCCPNLPFHLFKKKKVSQKRSFAPLFRYYKFGTAIMVSRFSLCTVDRFWRKTKHTDQAGQTIRVWVRFCLSLSHSPFLSLSLSS